MDEWQADEMRVLVRDAIAAHPEVEKVQGGPRSTEVTVTLKDGRMRVVATAIRDFL